MVPLSGDLKLRSQEKKSVFGAHFSFQIFNQETRNVYKEKGENTETSDSNLTVTSSRICKHSLHRIIEH